MKLKLKLAMDAVEEKDLFANENRNLYGAGYLAGFEKAREMAFAICLYDDVKNLGEEEVTYGDV